METLIVVTSERDWSLALPGARIVPARSYLLDPEFSSLRRAKIFNLCRNYRYQSLGYYVSLLAEARGHKSIPTVLTMQDLRSPARVRLASDELEEKIQKSLGPIQSDRFVLSIYFGRNVAKRHDRLANALFKLFPAPFLRVSFARAEQWEIQSISAIATSAIPAEHKEFAGEAIQAYFARRDHPVDSVSRFRFDLAILCDESDPTSPSNREAIEKFERAAEALDMRVELIDRGDYGRLPQFDALFIRTTTAVDDYTYRFSRRAATEGLVVIDDPISILRCTNKVFLAELLARNQIPTPRTRILHRDNFRDVVEEIGFPCILKRPDSSSSLGVLKADGEESLREHADRLFEDSDLLLVQSFLPTEFDWRIGILDGRPLYAARYYMAPRHWQIIKRDESNGRTLYGTTAVVPVEEVPEKGIRLARKAAALIGDGLYGVDLKQVGRDWYVIEVNDNPSIDHGLEDRILKGELYRRVMQTFLRRIEERKEGRNHR